VVGFAGDFTSRLVDMSNAPPASLRLSWICRTLRQLRSASCGYIERSASFAPALVDMSNAPPARSASCGYIERSASFTPALVDMSNAPAASLRLLWICRTLRQLRSAKAWQNRRADSGLPPLRWPFFNIQLVLRRMTGQELLQTLIKIGSLGAVK